MTTCMCCWPITSFYGFLKGLVCVGPCTAGFSVIALVITLISWPVNLWRTYTAILLTRKLGLTIKIVAALLAWIPLLLALPLVIICAIVVGFCYSLFGPMVYTFFVDKSFFVGGIGTTFRNCFFEFPKIMWRAGLTDMPNSIKEFEDYTLKEGEEPFDVPIWWVPVGLFYAFLGMLVNVPAGLLIGVIKCVPGILRAYYKLWCLFCGMKECCLYCLLFLPFVVANALLPVAGVVVALIVMPIVGAFLGLSVVVRAYKKGFRAGFEGVLRGVYDMDSVTNKLVFEADDCSCTPCFKLGEEMA